MKTNWLTAGALTLVLATPVLAQARPRREFQPHQERWTERKDSGRRMERGDRDGRAPDMRRTLRERFAQMPPERRRALMGRLKDMDPQERREFLQNLVRRFQEGQRGEGRQPQKFEKRFEDGRRPGGFGGDRQRERQPEGRRMERPKDQPRRDDRRQEEPRRPEERREGGSPARERFHQWMERLPEQQRESIHWMFENLPQDKKQEFLDRLMGGDKKPTPERPKQDRR